MPDSNLQTMEFRRQLLDAFQDPQTVSELTKTLWQSWVAQANGESQQLEELRQENARLSSKLHDMQQEKVRFQTNQKQSIISELNRATHHERELEALQKKLKAAEDKVAELEAKLKQD